MSDRSDVDIIDLDREGVGEAVSEHPYSPEWGDGSPCSVCMGPPGDHKTTVLLSTPGGGGAESPPPGKTYFADVPVPYTRDWVMRLPLREQGTLMAAIRGCDTVVDQFMPRRMLVGQPPYEGTEWAQIRHPTKAIVACLRYTVGVPHDEREVDSHGAFMASELPDVETWPVKCLDDLPLHFVMHLLHAIEVIGYRLPDEKWKQWDRLYARICEHMHVLPEPRVMMVARLSEDRIAKGTVKPRETRTARMGP